MADYSKFTYVDLLCDSVTACCKVWADKIRDNIVIPNMKTTDYSDGQSRIYPAKPSILESVIGPGPPTHIIDNIFLGSAYNAASKIIMEVYDIRFVLNITAEITNYFEDDESLGYKKFPLYDNNRESIMHYLRNTYDGIKEAQKLGGNILVHCFAGKSRSASIVAYYIMREKKIKPSIAFNMIKDKRPVINPTKKFVSDLDEIFNEDNLDGNNDTNYEDDIIICDL